MLNTFLSQPYLKPQTSDDEKKRFYNDALSLFSGEKSGHMNAYAFNQPDDTLPNDPVRGGQHWTNFIRTARDYYLITHESQIIQKYAATIGNILPAGASFYDLGPGETKAVIGKTLPMIKGLKNPFEFIAVDVNSEFAGNAASLIQRMLGISSKGVVQNFLSEDTTVTRGGNPIVMSLFGGLLCNSAKDKSLMGWEQLCQSFQNLKKYNMKSGDYLVITQDKNNDEQSLMRAYTHKFMGAYILSILHKIKRDLPVIGFNPALFEFVPHWDSNNFLLSLDAKLKSGVEQHDFVLGRTDCFWKQGDILGLVNSYKFPVHLFTKAAEQAGFESISVFEEDGNNIALHVLKAN